VGIIGGQGVIKNHNYAHLVNQENGIILKNIFQKVQAMGTKLNLFGKDFGRLDVVDLNGKNKWGNYLWKCKCECGKIIAEQTYWK